MVIYLFSNVEAKGGVKTSSFYDLKGATETVAMNRR